MALNYTQDQVEYITNQYRLKPDRDTVEKLSREGVYKKTEYTTKTGEKPVTKLEIVQELAERLELEIWQLAGLEKAPKSTLKALKENI